MFAPFVSNITSISTRISSQNIILVTTIIMAMPLQSTQQWLLMLATAVSFVCSSHAFQTTVHTPYHPHAKRSISSLHSVNNNESTQVYFDISISDTNIGRLIVHLPMSHIHHLPIHTSYFLSLVSSMRIGVDPKATFTGCQFQYSPSSIEDGSMRYRWGHICDGPALQIKSRDVDMEGMSESLIKSKHSCFGGTYYGISYADIVELINEEFNEEVIGREAVLLTVPTALSSKFSIVRVSESPKEWGERLLLNSAVIGYLDCESLDVLKVMAR